MTPTDHDDHIAPLEHFGRAAMGSMGEIEDDEEVDEEEE
jgi:hypothetical protein